MITIIILIYYTYKKLFFKFKKGAWFKKLALIKKNLKPKSSRKFNISFKDNLYHIPTLIAYLNLAILNKILWVFKFFPIYIHTKSFINIAHKLTVCKEVYVSHILD